MGRRQLRVSIHGKSEIFPLPDRGSVTIGRSDTCDVCIPDGTISRRHAAIHVDGELAIEDLGSHNGTVMLLTMNEGQAIKTGSSELIRLKPGARRALADNAMLQIGVAMLTVEPAAAQRSSFNQRFAAQGVIVEDRAMLHLYELAERVADSDISVLLLGESGVGKDVMARFIHASSPRAGARLTSLNCGALPETLLESELFGHEQGAFTGASKAKPGMFEITDGGTLFLDEIGELSPTLQVKLLRVLEDRLVKRVGGLEPRRIDLRFVSATNRNLEQDVANGTFRQDLFYRLNGIALNIPPLRERRADILPLARHFIGELAREQGRPVPVLASAAAEQLGAYSWPGNIRQLKNVLHRAFVLCTGTAITTEHILLPEAAVPPSTFDVPDADEDSTSDDTVNPELLRMRASSLERTRILDALEACGGNQTRAAEMLGLTRRALIGRLDKFGIPRPRKGRK